MSKFKKLTEWKTSVGPAIILEIRDDGSMRVWHKTYKGSWWHNADGKCAGGINGENEKLDLLEPWAEPEKGEVWVEVFKCAEGTLIHEIHRTKEDAMSSANGSGEYKALAVIGPISWTEGQRDDLEDGDASS